jgi:cell division protein FtsB
VADARRHPRISRRDAAQARQRRRAKAQARPPAKAQAARPAAKKRRTKNARARHPASNTPVSRQPPSPRVRRRRATLLSVLGVLAIVGGLFAFVYPTSTYLRQRAELGKATERLERLKAETARLERESEKLRGDAEVERLAREQYGLVRPGETPYVLVPSTPTTTAPVSDAPDGTSDAQT